ncbi:Glucooligosaccharide oxidase [Durotheca rogersii]|uniref:Glucooligosaccharide oxidase n=1 Tax=Durotheca rogersii TaxID=419775 RepID=UPI002220E23B|nr:Glucooligosaccharide oxidase [Durotheca rogersii]KAI5862351.1 Glucooligosaccharide oxidase [Durotheca rogersii]
MMVKPRGLVILGLSFIPGLVLGSSNTAALPATSAASQLATATQPINMGEDFNAFAKSIGLSSSQTCKLKAKYDAIVNGGNSPEDNLDLACQVAQESLGADQVDSAPVGQALINENWSLTCVADAYCVVLPRNTDETVKAVRVISYFKVKFAVRAGGHSPNPGWSSVGQEGILLDLQRLNQISLSSDKKLCSLGPGARWGNVVATLGTQNATVLAGRNPLVGVGGLILGGGYHHTSSEYGTVADNVKNFEVVLSNGTVVNANIDENNDLFWALKGGGPNFGIVTRFDVYTLPGTEIWYQLAIYGLDQAFDILDTFAKWQQNEGSSDFKANLILSLGIDSHVIGLVYSAPAPEVPSAFAPFFELTPLQVVVPATNGTFASLNEAIAPFVPMEQMRHDYGGVSSRVDAQLYKDVYTFWAERALAARDATGANQTFVLQHVPSNMVAQGIAKGGNPLGLIQETHQWWTTLVDWREAKDDDAARAVTIDTVAQWKKLGQERGLYLPFYFMNDSGRNQNPIAGYGQANVDKLNEVSRKYDSSQFFQTQQVGGFLLSRA